MIMECTDCKWCANFEFGWRVFCLHPELPPNEVMNYFPVGDENAEKCEIGFEESASIDFWGNDFPEASKFSEDKYQDVTYQGIREWCEMKMKAGYK